MNMCLNFVSSNKNKLKDQYTNRVNKLKFSCFIFKWSCFAYAYMCKGQLMLSIFLGNCPRHLFHKVHLALCFWLFRNGHHQKGCLLCSFVTKKYNTRVKEPVFVSSSYPRSWATSMHIIDIFFWINSKKVTANLMLKDMGFLVS
jgi:hypothetical protein